MWGIGKFVRKAPKRCAIVLLRPAAVSDRIACAQLKGLAPLINGKRIAVVGNAASIFDHLDGHEIDGHDLVVRMNHGVVRSPPHQGSRTDILCVATAMTKSKLMERFGEPIVIHTSAHRTRIMLSVIYDYPQLYFAPRAVWLALKRELRYGPSTGLMTLEVLSRYFSPGQLTLYGFDWMRTRTLYHEEVLTQWHDWDAEARRVGEWIAAGGGKWRLRRR